MSAMIPVVQCHFQTRNGTIFLGAVFESCRHDDAPDSGGLPWKASRHDFSYAVPLLGENGTIFPVRPPPRPWWAAPPHRRRP